MHAYEPHRETHEIDIGAWEIFVTRVRLMGRYRIGENVTGWSIGSGISF